MIPAALDQLHQKFTTLLEEQGVTWDSTTALSSPRRLAIFLVGLPRCLPVREEIVYGPPRSAAFDEQGNPTRAAEGFARKMGVSIEKLRTMDTKRGLYLVHQKNVSGKLISEVLSQAIPRLIASITWPKTMYWRESRFRFIRPLRWCVALWNDQILPFEFEGIRSGDTTRGHRFLGPRMVRLERADVYQNRMRDTYVLVDVEERKAKIRKEFEEVTPAGLKVLCDPILMGKVVHLNEYPTVICGAFDRVFLELPKEVLISVMRKHQSYFSVVNEKGEIQPFFLTVLNTAEDPAGKICKGHEKVLKARLEDAAFFWRADQKIPLRIRKTSLTQPDRLTQLEQVLFQEKLGTYRDKVERLRIFCSRLNDDSALETSALLSKVDLTTGMVREFAELQGVIGGLYAHREGYPKRVWKAIYEHYQPVSWDDSSPTSLNGALLSIVDKLDTIVGCFGIGIFPRGSSDPYALRRQAQSLVKVLLDRRLSYALPELVQIAHENFPPGKGGKHDSRAVLEFLEDRVRFIFQKKGIAYDVVNAVMAGGVDYIYRAYQKALALSQIRGEPDFEALTLVYRRIKNIIIAQPVELFQVRPKELVEKEEKDLYGVYREVETHVKDELEDENYLAALRKVASLRGVVDRFFDRVLVLTEETRLRQNRLRLLYDVSGLFLKLADMSEIIQSDKNGGGLK